VQLLQGRLKKRARSRRVPRNVWSHFRIHCLKHDLEALLLAAPETLRQRLKTTAALQGRWRRPVEDQNDQQPPKRIIEDLFDQYRKKARVYRYAGCSLDFGTGFA